ncbi:MAG: UDP-galactopyranose mutase, partial [Flavobacteriaceae bacterium]|nr:UDP-galactopyranose mutase [Flavobacteriaceae bacterium]
NTYFEDVEGINVDKYGANNEKIWDYVNSFVEFNQYANSPMANYEGELFNLPFNMNIFYQLCKVKSAAEAKKKIKVQVRESGIKRPKNQEEQATSLVGKDIYEKLIKGYTEKQWCRKATELPVFIIKRLPVQFAYDNYYSNDKYQRIPIGGCNKMVEGLLGGIERKTGIDFFKDREMYEQIAHQIVFKGKIDEYFDYQFGKLEYRSLDFEHEHFEFGKQHKTLITREYPKEWKEGSESYYPVNDEKNSSIYLQYKRKAEQTENVIFGGRLAEYKYYDMHQVIASALSKVEK